MTVTRDEIWQPTPGAPYPTESLDGHERTVNLSILPDGTAVVSLSLHVPDHALARQIGHDLLHLPVGLTIPPSPPRPAALATLARTIWSDVYQAMREEGVCDGRAMAHADIVRNEFERRALSAAPAPAKPPLPDPERLARALFAAGCSGTDPEADARDVLRYLADPAAADAAWKDAPAAAEPGADLRCEHDRQPGQCITLYCRNNRSGGRG